MNQFKTRVGAAPIYDVNEMNYLKATGKIKPYCVQSKHKKESLYAVCPACDNPIQIIGLRIK